MKRFLFRGVAQPGSALGLGPRGRMFESSRPDQSTIIGWEVSCPLSSLHLGRQKCSIK
jgi:hypothetical protein